MAETRPLPSTTIHSFDTNPNLETNPDSKSKSPEFSILPASLPADLPSILALHYNEYLLGKTFQPIPPSGPISLEEYIEQHSTYQLYRLTRPHCHVYKTVHHSPTSASNTTTLSNETATHNNGTPIETLTAYIALHSPLPPSTLTIPMEQQHATIRAEIEMMNIDNAELKALSFQLTLAGKAMHAHFIGEGYQQRFWSIESLFVGEKWQRRGLGTGLVEFGVEVAREGVKEEENGEEKGERKVEREGKAKVEGMWVMASDVGESVYAKCGFEKVGEKTMPLPVGEGALYFAWYLMRL